jgi:hypothetical protein
MLRFATAVLICLSPALAAGTYLHGAATAARAVSPASPAAPKALHSQKPLAEGSKDHHAATPRQDLPSTPADPADRVHVEKIHDPRDQRLVGAKRPNDAQGMIDESAGGTTQPHHLSTHMQAQRTARHQGGDPFTNVEVHEMPIGDETVGRRRR